MDKEPISNLLTRSALYHLLSLAFLYPEEQNISALQGGMETMRNAPLAGNLPAKVEALLFILTRSPLPELQAQYRAIFGHVLSPECPLYETEYGNRAIFQQAQQMGDIAGFYRAFGLEVSPTAKERLDHLSIQLEFMHVLTFKEAYALEHHGMEAAELCREAQQKFLNDHLGRWVPFLVRLLSRKIEKGFYRDLALLIGEFLTQEVHRLGVTPLQYNDDDLKPVSMEPEEDCCFSSDGCPFLENSREGSEYLFPYSRHAHTDLITLSAKNKEEQ